MKFKTKPIAIILINLINIHYISAILCHQSCLTCSDITMVGCLSCTTGLYLSGSSCVTVCPFYTMISTNKCVVGCPTSYYLNSINNYCQPCSRGCQTCISQQSCIIWGANQNPSNLFFDYLYVWVIVVAFVLFLIGLIIWKACIKNKNSNDQKANQVLQQRVREQKGLNDQIKRKQSHATHQSQDIFKTNNFYVEEIDEIHMTTKIDVRGNHKASTIDGIEVRSKTGTGAGLSYLPYG